VRPTRYSCVLISFGTPTRMAITFRLEQVIQVTRKKVWIRAFSSRCRRISQETGGLKSKHQESDDRGTICFLLSTPPKLLWARRPNLHRTSSTYFEGTRCIASSCFAYLPVQHRPDATVGLISNYPSAWTRHYLQSHYERFDPVIVQALAEPEPFEWGLGVGSTGRPSQNGSFSRKPLNLVSVAVLRFQFTIMAAQPQR
jgi:hypothetical protein